MRALPQRPGPDGSRVIKNRSSVPRLGDHLVAITARDHTIAKSTVAHAEPDVSVTLTSSNLDQHTKATQFSGDSVPVRTTSVCSNEDVVLINRLDKSVTSGSSSRLSPLSHTRQGYETPPTTLNGDDCLMPPFDKDTTFLSYSANGKDLSSTEFTLSPTDGMKNSVPSKSATTTKNKCQPPTVTGSPSKKDGHIYGLPMISSAMSRPLDSLEPVSVYATIEANSTGEVVPNAKSSYSTVGCSLATEAAAKNISPLTIDPEVSNKAKPFWDLQRIFDFYLQGAITPAKAKETAKRNGYPDAVRILDRATQLGGNNPSLHAASVVLKAAKKGSIGNSEAPPNSSAVNPEHHRYDTVHRELAQKLSTYSAEDDSTGPARLLHIFVDISNIHVGFCDSWKISRNIPIHHYIRAPTFNFKVLCSIMERNRATEKKILVGSVANTVNSPAQWPHHFVEARARGYKMNILNRVQKMSSGRVRRRRNVSPQRAGIVGGVDLTSSDESTVDQLRAGYATRNGEQGVDELLHLNMMDSVLDQIRKPGTMVLATGDAARAEFSDGFLQYATRALDQGWNLELVTWKKAISSAWMNPKFRNKYGQRFRIIYLDEFLEELNEDLCPWLA